MSSEFDSFLGVGWSFPPTFDKSTNGVRMSADFEDIQESIGIILSTIPGERIMQPKFGCDLRSLIFEEFDTSFIMEMNDIIYQALLHFEPRIIFIDAEILSRDERDGFINIQINYTLIITNTRHNLVYPYYILEGTNTSE